MAKFILWAGSKDKLLPEINKRFDEELPNAQYYIEPFLGGGSVLLSVLQNYPKLTCYANDKNEVLMNTWKVLQEFPEELADEVDSIRSQWEVLTKDEDKNPFKRTYLKERDKLNRMIATKSFGLPMAVSFLVVNHMGYNGLFRVNSKGLCNTPPGVHHAFPIREELKELSARIKSVKFSSDDFSTFLQKFDKKEKVFIYADPPYLPVTKTASFTDYTSGGFGEEEQRELAILVQKHRFLAHGSWSDELEPLYKEMYSDCEIAKVSARRNINCKTDKRGEVQEIIIRSK